jgi:heme-degrading monooxygenase HmoA
MKFKTRRQILHIILWKYQVKPERRSEFEAIYSPNGAWAELFKKGIGYIGTEFLRDETNPQRYLTIDRWESKEDCGTFLSQYEKEYRALDAQCDGLTESESLIGKWTTI